MNYKIANNCQTIISKYLQHLNLMFVLVAPYISGERLKSTYFWRQKSYKLHTIIWPGTVDPAKCYEHTLAEVSFIVLSIDNSFFVCLSFFFLSLPISFLCYKSQLQLFIQQNIKVAEKISLHATKFRTKNDFNKHVNRKFIIIWDVKSICKMCCHFIIF